MPKPWETDLAVYDDEELLLEGLRRREPLACNCLLKRYAPRLYRVALNLVGSSDEAEDVLQEALIRACDQIERFEGRSALSTWLQRIVINTALMRLRKAAAPIDPLDEALLPVSEAEPAGALLSGELAAVIEGAVAKLQPSLRAAFVLRDIEGFSTEEAAEMLEITPSALKVRLHRARQALQQHLAPYLKEPPHA